MMRELGNNLWTNEAGTSNTNPVSLSSSSYLTVMHEIHVLVVDHEVDTLINTAQMLEFCQYRVTISELPSGAIQVLSSGKVYIDLILANINSPDLHVFKLLQEAASTEIPVVLMSTEDNAFMAMRALESGACSFIKKPLAIEVVKGLWQYVMKEKIKAAKERKIQLMAANYNGRGGIENPNNVVDAGGVNNMAMMDKGKSKGNDYKEDENHMIDGKVKRKVCTEWTQDLHEKFMSAVETLGEGRCFPKEILELMDVPELTRMQVASHLQKCRNDNWRSPEVRKSMTNPHRNAPSGQDPNKPRRFGSMPKGSKTSASKENSGSGGAGEGMKTPQSGTEVHNVENMETEPAPVVVAVEDNPPYHPQYEPIAYPGNPRNTSDDHFFTFEEEVECLVGLPAHVSAGMNIASSSAAGGSGYHFVPTYHHLEQNTLKVPSEDNGSPWSSETTSNYGSDDHDSVLKGP